MEEGCEGCWVGEVVVFWMAYFLSYLVREVDGIMIYVFEDEGDC